MARPVAETIGPSRVRRYPSDPNAEEALALMTSAFMGGKQVRFEVATGAGPHPWTSTFIWMKIK